MDKTQRRVLREYRNGAWLLPSVWPKGWMDTLWSGGRDAIDEILLLHRYCLIIVEDNSMIKELSAFIRLLGLLAK